ncbi:MAG TPA: NTP transferase domain-containing protein [Thermoanaerobaculia bacterium]|nr:NTP transferase domain-containing protein [Thermoanaerobaculia bacterium]
MKLLVLAAGFGTRLFSETGGRPKALVDVGGTSLLDRLVGLADLIGLEPVVVARSAHVADFRARGVDVLVEDHSPHMIVTLANACRQLSGPLCWVGADMLFTDPAPLAGLVGDHLASDSFCSFLYCRSDRFKVKLDLAPEPAVAVTRDGVFPYSCPNFVVQAERVCAWLPGDLDDPRASFVQRAIERGERILFREYHAPVFEIDTPAHLAEARRHFARCA